MNPSFPEERTLSDMQNTAHRQEKSLRWGLLKVPVLFKNMYDVNDSLDSSDDPRIENPLGALKFRETYRFRSQPIIFVHFISFLPSRKQESAIHLTMIN